MGVKGAAVEDLATQLPLAELLGSGSGDAEAPAGECDDPSTALMAEHMAAQERQTQAIEELRLGHKQELRVLRAELAAALEGAGSVLSAAVDSGESQGEQQDQGMLIQEMADELEQLRGGVQSRQLEVEALERLLTEALGELRKAEAQVPGAVESTMAPVVRETGEETLALYSLSEEMQLMRLSETKFKELDSDGSGELDVTEVCVVWL